MVFVEFFDKTYVENICISLIKMPEKIILVGPDSKTLENHRKKYLSMFAKRGASPDIECCVAFRNNLPAIVERLSRIAEENEDVHFDLTGGEELYLVAAGIVYERFPEKNIQLHKYSIKSSKIIDCDGDETNIVAEGRPYLSVKENIELYGGLLKSAEAEKSSFILNGDIREDIRNMWRICTFDAKKWNKQVGVFEYLSAFSKADENGLTVCSSPSILNRAKKPQPDKAFLRKLAESGLITYEYDTSNFKVVFKNELVRSCLEKSGKILEMMIYMLSVDAVDENGNSVYCDAVSGAFIDWDGVITPNRPNTENEIDVILMRGVMPIFISCKNGNAEGDEVYKLRAVAEKFGSDYAKKVLIVGSSNDIAESTVVRGNDMGLNIIDNVHKMSEKELKETVSNLWQLK